MNKFKIINKKFSKREEIELLFLKKNLLNGNVIYMISVDVILVVLNIKKIGLHLRI